MTTVNNEIIFEPSDEIKTTKVVTERQVSKEENDILNKIFENAKKVTTEEVKKKSKTYFTTSKGKMIFSIDKTNLDLTLTTRVGKGLLEDRYYKQLEELVFGGKKDIDPNSLLSVLMLMDLFIKDKYPVEVRSGKHKTNLNKIVTTLNKFFNENFMVLESMYKMFNETITKQVTVQKE